MKTIKLNKKTLCELSTREIGEIKGGLMRASDSINTKFTKICECCKTGCPTSVTAPIDEEDSLNP